MCIRDRYEYYVGIFKLNKKNTKNPSPSEIDEFMYIAACNNLNFYRPLESVTNKDYPTSIPSEFGKEFRTIRNRISHTDYRRMQPEVEKEEISISEFYLKYNFIIHKLLSHPQFAWGGKHFHEGYEWQPVSEFATTLRQSK